MRSPAPIFVTKPYLPPLEDFMPYLQKIWSNKILTNGGPFHQQLEDALCEYLGVEHICLFANGTIALVTALQALQISGEVITTPYSFVATAHSLLWNGIKPIFVDIDPHTLNLDPTKIEAAISSNTTAILPVHCYGQPCEVDAIQRIADDYGLKVIYDAAHAFGVKFNDCSVLKWGDLSVLSFHATKVFNTFEGGAIVCPSLEIKRKIDNLKNFGFVDEVTVIEPGINGKMSEINAAFGLLQLTHMDEVLAQRKVIDRIYREALKECDGILCLNGDELPATNYSYFPILVQNNYRLTRDELYLRLKNNNVFARRYFYPLITNFPMYKKIPSANSSNLKVALDVAEKVLCLPIYPGLTTDEQQLVIDMIVKE